MKNKTILTLGLLAALIQPVTAAVIINPISATASHEQNPQSIAGFTVDGKGLEDATTVTNGAAVPTAWTTHSISSDDMWRTLNSQPISEVTITFDLGGSHDLTGMHVWTYNESWNGSDDSFRGIQNAVIEYSSDGVNFTSLGTNTFLKAASPTTTSYAGDDYALALSDVTTVRFTVVDNYGGDRVGLAEVRFIGDAIPEPATLSLVGAIAGGMFFIRRRFMI